MTEEQNPQEALDLIRNTREQTLAKMDHWPWWYDCGYALACGLLVAGQGFPTAFSLPSVGIALAILVVIMRRWQAERGVWVNGYSPKRARWAAFGLAAILIGLMGLSIWFGRIQAIYWVPVVNGLAGAALGYIGSRVWMRLYRQDVRNV